MTAGAAPGATTMGLRPIGVIRTPWATPAQCPRNGRQSRSAPVCRAVLRAEFLPGLEGIDGFSHLILLYWLHEAGPARLVFRPPFDSAPRGVFATRAPARPNPIGFSVVAFDGRDGEGALLVRFLDCADNTPLLDVKPYLPSTDAEPEASMGWLAPHATARGG